MRITNELSGPWSALPIWLRVIAIIAILNFGSFIIGELYLGGDALSGKIENGRFYLGWKGMQKEVSQTIYTYSLVHESSMYYFTHPLVLIAAGWYYSKKRK